MSLLGDNAFQKDRDRGRGAGTPALEHYMAHGYHTALQAKPTGSLEHCMTTMGKARDPDGSVRAAHEPLPYRVGTPQGFHLGQAALSPITHRWIASETRLATSGHSSTW